MSTWKKTLLLELFLIVGLTLTFGFPAVFLYALWCWQIFAFMHYRHCRQEEFLFVLQTAAATQAPLEALLYAYLQDRPREHFFRGTLLFFVFPGYYWIHLRHSFDTRLTRVAALLELGVPLSEALRKVPGVVPADVALAVAVGQFTGKLPEALRRLPDRKLAALWIELGARFLYPLMLMSVMFGIVCFLMSFIVPKFEKIFMEFRLQLPYLTELLISVSRFLVKYWWLLAFAFLDLLIFFNLLLFSSTLRWYFPLIGRLYQMHQRGQFLQTLGLMLETAKPLPAILDSVLEAELLPSVVRERVDLLAEDLRRGMPLADALMLRGLVTESMGPLIASAEKANNLPWALRELGDSLVRRSALFTERLALIAFPLLVFTCACVIGFVAVSIFWPLAALLEKIHG